MFAVVDFEAVAQAIDFRIERRHFLVLCWMQDSKMGSLRHQIASRLNANSQTDWAIDDHAKRNLNSTATPYNERAFSPLDFITDGVFAPGSGDICLLLLIAMLWHKQAIFESRGYKWFSSAECRIRSWEVSDTNSPADWMPIHKPTKKTWTQQVVPMTNEHSA